MKRASFAVDHMGHAPDVGKVRENTGAHLLKDMRAVQHARHDELIRKLETCVERQERIVDRMEGLLTQGSQNAGEESSNVLQSQDTVHNDREYYSIDFDALLELNESSSPDARMEPASAALPKSAQNPMHPLRSMESEFLVSLQASEAMTSMGLNSTCGEVVGCSRADAQDKERRKQKFRKFASMEREMVEAHSKSPSRQGLVAREMLSQNADRDSLRRLKYLVNSGSFGVTVAFMILSNAIFMGIQIDYGGRGGVEVTTFHLVDIFFAMIFLVELLLRIGAEGWQFLASDERSWNVLDSIIVIATIIEVVMASSESSLKNVGILRLLRVLRIFKMMRLVKLVRIFRSLRIMIQAIFSTLRSLMWALFLLTGIMYAFALLFTSAALDAISGGDVEEEPLQKFYGTVPRSMLTLFESMSSGMDWGEAARPLGDIGSVFVIMFIVYICFVCFAVLNLITGHFCHTAIESAATDMQLLIEDHQRRAGMYKDTLRRLFLSIDVLHNGGITLNDFRRALEQKETREFFHSLDINVTDAWDVFKFMNRDEDNGMVDLDEFINGCFQLRGPAKAVELAKLAYAVNWLTTQFGEFTNYLATTAPSSRLHLSMLSRNASGA